VFEPAHQRRAIRGLMRGETIDPGFRQRLMLAVTEVNGCRYARARTPGWR
jgi:hypothetical protein